MNAKFQNRIPKSKTLNLYQGKVQNDILSAPNQFLKLAQTQGIPARHLNFGFDLKFEL